VSVFESVMIVPGENRLAGARVGASETELRGIAV